MYNNGLFEETVNVFKLTLMALPKKHPWFFSKWKKVKTHACVLGIFSCDCLEVVITLEQVVE